MKLEWIVDRRGAAGAILDQGQRPTCLACAVSVSHADRCGSPRSVEFLHYSSRSKACGSGSFESVREVLSDEGQPPEGQWPYDADASELAVKVPPTVKGPFSIASLDLFLPSATSDELVRQLEDGDLPVVGLAITQSFMDIGSRVLLRSETPLARHAVLLVGAARYRGPDRGAISDSDLLMCVQNSWGPEWGNQGLGLIGPNAWERMALASASIEI